MHEFGPSTYGDGFADVYDEWYGNITDAEATAAFLAARSPAGAPVIELGVGTGRLVPALVATGRPVFGVDASPAMLDIGRQVADAPELTLAVSDLAALPLAPTARFGAALCAFNTLFNVPSAAGQQHVFERVAPALRPDGVMIIEALSGERLANSDGSSVGVSRSEEDRIVLSTTTVDGAAQTIKGQHVDVHAEGEVVIRPWQLRWTTPSQLDEMAKAARLQLSERYGGWDGSPFTTDSDTHISVYRPIQS